MCTLLIACGSGTTKPTQPNNTSDDGSGNGPGISTKRLTCDQRVELMRSGGSVEPQTSIDLPEVGRWRAFTGSGVIAEVTRRNVVVDGSEVSWVNLDQLEKLLATAAKRESKNHDGLETPFYIVAEGAVAASRLNDILKSTPKNLSPRLVVKRSKAAAPIEFVKQPIDAGRWFGGWLNKTRALTAEQATADELRKGEIKSELTHLYRSGIKKAVGTDCAELLNAYRNAAKAKPEERGAALAKAIPDALAACKCKGVDRAYDVINHIMSGRPHTKGWLPLPATISDPGSVKNVATLLSAKQPPPRTK